MLKYFQEGARRLHSPYICETYDAIHIWPKTPTFELMLRNNFINKVKKVNSAGGKFIPT